MRRSEKRFLPNVTAPAPTLADDFLFWEGSTRVSTLGSGFALHVEDAVCVRSDTLATGWLQDALLAQGLNITEATEMATHWLPQMVEQSYVLISFVPKCILDRHAPLAISPTPQLLHRVFMLFSPVDIPPPTARSAVIPPPSTRSHRQQCAQRTRWSSGEACAPFRWHYQRRDSRLNRRRSTRQSSRL